MLEFSSHSYPVARKEHRCDLCCSEIKVGEEYSRFSGMYEGRFFDHKHHLLCERIISQYCDHVGDNEYDNDNVIDWVTEIVCGDCEHSHYDDGADDCSFSNMFVCPKVIERFAEKEEIREKE